MADRYDPKVTVRPTNDRKGGDTRQGPATSDDPLFELARIVSGRGPATTGAPAPLPLRGRSAPAPEPAKPAPSEPNVLGDLEAELLSDLQASFAAVKEAIEPARGAAPAKPELVGREPAAPSPPLTEPTLPEPPRVRQPEAAPPTRAAPPPQRAPEVHAPLPSSFAPPSPQEPAPPRMSAAARPPIQQAPAPRQPAAPPPRERAHTPPEQPITAPPPAAPRKVEVGNLTLRPTSAPHVQATPAPPPVTTGTGEADKPVSAAARASRWDRPAEPPKQQQANVASRFAPPRAANQSHPAPGLPAAPPPAEDEELPFGDGPPFAHEGEDAADEFPLDAFDIVPGYGDDVEVPPYPDDDLEQHERRGVPRMLVALAGILAVVLIGVLGFVMLRPGASGGGTPPIISADAGPTKIAPPEPPATGDDQQNKLIYDRVDNGAAAGAGTGDTNLVTPGNEPIAEVPSTDTNNPIARVILPGGPSPEAPGTADSGSADAAAATPGGGDTGADVAATSEDAGQSIGPRKVRTVVVRPDGTIVSSDAVPAPGDAPASTDATPAPAATAETPSVPDVPPVPADDDTAAIAGGQSGQDLAITPNPGGSANPPPTPAPAAAAEAPAPKPVPTPAPSPQPKPAAPKVVATGGDGGPIDLTPGGGAAAQVASGGQTAAPLTAGGMMVQVSSQRTEDAARATYRDLQARYPSILGGYAPNIQKAELGDRGTYYRVRVGPLASADAQTLCGALKNAGGDCILSPR